MTDKDTVTLEIATPKGLFKGAFSMDLTISEVIQYVLKEMGLGSGDKYELVRDGTSLGSNGKKLSELGLSGVEKLELVATGRGV